MTRLFRWIFVVWVGVAGWLIPGGSISRVSAQELDFRQQYERGKLLYQRKLYADAINELKKASYTVKGRSFFGVYYYLALSYFWLPDIRQAHRTIQIAQRFAKNATHRSAIKRLYNRIEQLYGKVTIVPEVDPDEVGRLLLSLKPKSEFSNKHKQRYFRILRARLKKSGVVPNNRAFYIPKGDYEVAIANPQCLQYGLFQGSSLANEVSVGDGTLQLRLKAGRSCECTGGQKMYKSGKKMYCACPPGTGWNQDKQRCEVGVNPVPWIIAGIGVVVVGATAVVIGLVVAQNDGTDYRLIRNPNATDNSNTKLWK